MSRPTEWTEAEIERLKKMKQAGRSYIYIGRALGKTEGAVKMCVQRLRQSDPDYEEPVAGTLCWRCVNAVPDPETGAGCPWSRRFEPVEGWTAFPRRYDESTGNHGVSYQVTACPSYAEG